MLAWIILDKSQVFRLRIILVPLAQTFVCNSISDKLSILAGKSEEKAKGLAFPLGKEKGKKELKGEKS